MVFSSSEFEAHLSLHSSSLFCLLAQELLHRDKSQIKIQASFQKTCKVGSYSYCYIRPNVRPVYWTVTRGSIPYIIFYFS